MKSNIIYQGDALKVLKTLPPESVNCCITSPPYWGLRDYGIPGQLGMEETPEKYIINITKTLEEVRRILRKDATLWLNMGDCHNANGRKGHGSRIGYLQTSNRASFAGADQNRPYAPRLKPTDLVGIPWMLAFALRDAGWYLRSDIIWAKPNPMPESVRNRPTRAHEYLFMLSKNKKYFYDANAIKEPCIGGSVQNRSKIPSGWDTGPGSHNKLLGGYQADKQRGHSRRHAGFNDRWDQMTRKGQTSGFRNRRSVWTIAPKPFKGAHFATFPPALIEPGILAGCPQGGIVLDPFMGAGTTALVATQHGRRYIGCELNPAYIEIANRRLDKAILDSL